MVNQKVIHFVCTGNTYRSRLAEASFNSKAPKTIKATSSGVEAHNNENGPISWYTARLLKNHNLIKHMSFSWTQTTEKILKKADHIIFLTPLHKKYCEDYFNFKQKNYEVWDIKDIDEMSENLSNDLANIKSSELTYLKIKNKVENLISKL